jgi:hypothetical protein
MDMGTANVALYIPFSGRLEEIFMIGFSAEYRIELTLLCVALARNRITCRHGEPKGVPGVPWHT